MSRKNVHWNNSLNGKSQMCQHIETKYSDFHHKLSYPTAKLFFIILLNTHNQTHVLKKAYLKQYDL